MTCMPEESNVFTSTSISIGECKNNSDIRQIIIKGEWDKYLSRLEDNSNIKLSFDNVDGELIECVYQNEIGFICDFKVEGIIKIKEQYFEGHSRLLSRIYKIKKYESVQTASSCSDNNSKNNDDGDGDSDGDDDDDDFNDKTIRGNSSANSLQFFNKIIIIFSLLFLWKI